MDILSYNPGHDGAVVHLSDGCLVFSVESEKDSNYRYTPVGVADLAAALARLDGAPDVLAVGGWWPRESQVTGAASHVGYRGVSPSEILLKGSRMLGRDIRYFSSSHERSHILCAIGLSPYPKGTPSYVLIWEGAIGAFYEVDRDTNITLLGNVMNQPGNRYAAIYGLADPTFPKSAPFSRLSDAGKLMALASYSTRKEPTPDEEQLMEFLLESEDVRLDLYDQLEQSPYFNVGVEDKAFRDFAGIYSDRIFDTFARFVEENLRSDMPLLIAGGCGLNCDWNSRWAESGLFTEVFVPPVPNDSGSAIGTAIDAQLRLSGDPKVDWSVYAGLDFDSSSAVGADRYDIWDVGPDEVAAMLTAGMILGWVNGSYEIGPRALGNRSIVAAPFDDSTRIRLNQIKQREQFRPIAPVCLEEDALQWFGCDRESPFMLFTFTTHTDRLRAVTHVNGSARIQTVNERSNPQMHALLSSFKAMTGFGVLCNTSLNFNGKGFINNLADLDTYALEHGLDGFVVNGRGYFRKTSQNYAEHRAAVLG